MEGVTLATVPGKERRRPRLLPAVLLPVLPVLLVAAVWPTLAPTPTPKHPLLPFHTFSLHLIVLFLLLQFSLFGMILYSLYRIFYLYGLVLLQINTIYHTGFVGSVVAKV